MAYGDQLNIKHALGHRIINGLFDRGACAYCGAITLDFCPECEFFVCRNSTYADTGSPWVSFRPLDSGCQVPARGQSRNYDAFSV